MKNKKEIKIDPNANKYIVQNLLNDRRREYPQGGIISIRSGSTSESIIWESKKSWGDYYDVGVMTIYNEDLDMYLDIPPD